MFVRLLFVLDFTNNKWFIILFTQYIKKTNTQYKTFFNLIIQHLDKYIALNKQLTYRGWHRGHWQEELLTVGGRRGGR